jgi:hypothetical protein
MTEVEQWPGSGPERYWWRECAPWMRRAVTKMRPFPLYLRFGRPPRGRYSRCWWRTRRGEGVS